MDTGGVRGPHDRGHGPHALPHPGLRRRVDVNKPYDWPSAEELVRSGKAALPEIRREPYPVPEMA